MANYMIIGSDGQQYGPVASEDLRKWLAEGRVVPQTKVQVEGTTEWVLLAEVPEFASPAKSFTPPPLPSGASAAPGKTSALAVTSLVLGILGLFTCGFTALFGLIFGIVALVKVSNSRGALRGRGLALAGTIVSGIFLLMIPIFAALLLPALSAAKQKALEITCLNNEKQMALGVLLYSEANNSHLPPAATWCDAIKKNVGSESVFKCPTANVASRCDYAFNAKLDGLDEGKVNPQTVMIFESDAGWNAHGGTELVPATARHGHGTQAGFVVAFADGHVEIVPQSRISTLRWDP